MVEKSKNRENFFAENVFTFDSYPCDGKIGVSYPYPDTPTKVLILSTDTSKKLHFAFGAKIGLVRLNEDGSIAESNILGKLLAINSAKIENYLPFFKANGFLFPIGKGYEIDENALRTIIDRLHATLELLSTITDMSRTSYEKIIRLIIYHLFVPIVAIETQDGKFKYVQSKHPYTFFLEKAHELEKDERLNDTFNNSEFVFDDFISKTTTLPADFITKTLDGKAADERFNTDLFQKIIKVYCAPRQSIQKGNLYINDFLFHYFYEVGVVEHVNLDTTVYADNIVNKNNFSDQLKSAAVIIAKQIIKEEIESNLRRVRPTYNVKDLEPAWIIDSLLSALYFGLFYMRPKMEIYRQCANPNCREFFLVSVTSSRQKYCCVECTNAVMQARHRAKKKQSETIRK